MTLSAYWFRVTFTRWKRVLLPVAHLVLKLPERSLSQAVGGACLQQNARLTGLSALKLSSGSATAVRVVRILDSP